MKFEPLGKIQHIEDALWLWIKSNQRSWAHSTTRDYISLIKTHLIPNFGHLKMSQLERRHIQDWIDSQTVSAKRINNALTPLRMIFKEAFLDGHINDNIMARIKNLKIKTREAKPFSTDEIAAILTQLSGQERDVIELCFFTGLRTSELIALTWDDVDFPNQRINVTKAKVRGRLKEPKTSAGRRQVELCERSQHLLLSMRNPVNYSDNLFIDPKSGVGWASDQPLRKRVWIPALKRAGVTYREPYQMRHTYASQMLSSGKNPLWVAMQLGHSDWGMIRKIYGRWIPRSQKP
ncbi:tyrosine-type recombinase/integrase [Kineobactrum sediminis]|nr:site-specific integrase [Kineobactrum sediminis]